MRLSTLIVLILTGCFFLASIGYVGYHSLETELSNESSTGDLMNRINQEQRVQFLLMHAPDQSLQLVYLVSYDSISGRLSAIYLPPGIKIMSPSYGEIMSLKNLHEQFQSSEVPRELESTLQLEIPFWIETHDKALKELVDSLGGINVEFPVRASSDSASRRTRVRWMDGVQIKQYVSKAYDRFGSQGRRFRHKTFFLGVLKRVKQRGEFFSHPRTARWLNQRYKSNLSRSDWKTIGHLIGQLQPDRIKFPSTLHLMKTGASRETLDSTRLKNMLPKPLKKMIEKAEPKKLIEVQVLNGAGLPGLAGTVRDKLQPKQRVDVVEVGNADRYNYDTTQIIDRNNNPKSAARLREILGTGSIQSKPSKRLLVDVTIIVGRDLKHLRSR